MNNVTHHYEKCPNYKYHVLEIGGSKFCNGCFANSVFLCILLPIYLLILVDFPTNFIVPILTFYILVNLVSFIVYLYNHNTTYLQISSFLSTLFLFASHIMILFLPLKFTFNFEVLSSLIVILSIPQFSMYLWKITTSNEFRFPKSKFIIRMLFIHAYLFAVLMLNQSFLIALSIIIITAVSFAGLRQISAIKVKEPGSCKSQDKGFCANLKINTKIEITGFSPNLRTTNALKFDESAEGGIEDCCGCCCGLYCCMCLFGMG